MKECHNCSKQIANNAKKCKYCGESVEKQTIKVKRGQKIISNENDIEQLLCPICGGKYKKQGICGDVFCDKCMKVFFDEARGRNSHSFLDKYISYDELRRGEWETARKRSCHEHGFSNCVVCNINSVDKTRDPNSIAYGLLAESYYYDFFLCRECVARFLAAYNVRLRPGEEYMIPSKSLESMNGAPFKKFKDIWQKVQIYAENMKVVRRARNMRIAKITGICLILILIIRGIISLIG